jgi:1,4-dihydroxy-2-naphthoyl-CoA hydrolase
VTAERSLILDDPEAMARNLALLKKIVAEVDANTVLGALDVRITSYDPDAVTVETEVSDRLFQHGGIVHGGVYVLLAESAASTAAATCVDITTFRVSGMEINANHLRSVTSGALKAVATPVHRGQTSHVYRIEISDQDGRLISVGRCTMAIRRIPGL